MVEGEEILTTGFRGFSGDRTVTIAESGREAQFMQSDVSFSVHCALSTEPGAIVMFFPTLIKVLPEG